MPESQAPGDWRVVYEEPTESAVYGTPSDRLQAWRAVEDPAGQIQPGDIRVDYIRTASGHRLRIRVRVKPGDEAQT